MDNLDKIKFKETAVPDWYCKIDVESGEKIEFSRLFGSGRGLFKEMQAWVAAGNTVEPEYTESELAKKDIDDLKEASKKMREERDRRILEADKWELQSVMQRFGLSNQQIMDYKQILLDMPQTHTTIDQLNNPQWPDKLITQDLL